MTKPHTHSHMKKLTILLLVLTLGTTAFSQTKLSLTYADVAGKKVLLTINGDVTVDSGQLTKALAVISSYNQTLLFKAVDSVSKRTAKILRDTLAKFTGVVDAAEEPNLIDPASPRIYQLSAPIVPGTKVQVQIDGLSIRPGYDYDYTNTGKITLRASQPLPARWIFVYYQKTAL